MPNLNSPILEQLRLQYFQLAPHVRERQTGKLVGEAITEMERLQMILFDEVNFLRQIGFDARADELMRKIKNENF